MRKGRWLAVWACTSLVAMSTGLLYLAISRGVGQGSALRFVPYIALLGYAAVPLLAALLSGHRTPYGAAAGGVALGIATIVATAIFRQGGTGALPLTLGIAVAGTIALNGNAREIRARIVVIVLLAIYTAYSGRLLSVLFAYPLLGLADEFADAIGARRKAPAGRRDDAPTTARS